MSNKKFKKMIKKEFNEEFNYDGDYVKIMDKLEAENRDVSVFNKGKFIRRVSYAFTCATLFIVALSIVVSSFVIEAKGRGEQKELEKYIMTEEEITIAESYCYDVIEEPIYFINIDDTYISIYKCHDNKNNYYFVRATNVINDITVTFDEKSLNVKDGFYFIGSSSYEINNNHFSITLFNTMNEVIYSYELIA